MEKATTKKWKIGIYGILDIKIFITFNAYSALLYNNIKKKMVCFFDGESKETKKKFDFPFFILGCLKRPVLLKISQIV